MVAENSQEIFDILYKSERKLMKRAFAFLENDDYQNALKEFVSLISGDFTYPCKSFAYYGLGMVYTKKSSDEGMTSLTDIDQSISNFKLSKEILDFADVHMMLAYALRQKMTYLFTHKPGTIEKYKDITCLIDEAVSEFTLAYQFDRFYEKMCKEDINDLLTEKQGLERLIKKLEVN